MEQTISIQKIEAKTTKAGMPMWTITSTLGKMNTFSKEIADALVVGQTFIVEVEENNGYKNLMKVIGKSNMPAPSFTPAVNIAPLSRDEQIKQKRFDSASFSISYAVRLAEAGKIKVEDINQTAKNLLALYEDMLNGVVAVEKIAQPPKV